MKTVYAIVTYEAHVPDDMNTSDIIDAFEREINDRDDIRVNVIEYPDEEEAEPLFSFNNFEIATSFSLSTSLK